MFQSVEAVLLVDVEAALLVEVRLTMRPGYNRPLVRDTYLIRCPTAKEARAATAAARVGVHPMEAPVVILLPSDIDIDEVEGTVLLGLASTLRTRLRLVHGEGAEEAPDCQCPDDALTTDEASTDEVADGAAVDKVGGGTHGSIACFKALFSSVVKPDPADDASKMELSRVIDSLRLVL